MKRLGQLKLDAGIFKGSKAFGGTLLKKAKNRHGRPLSTKLPIHLVLKSLQARGEFSFYKPSNRVIVQRALKTLSVRYGVQVLQFANAGNHLHFLIRLSNRFTYSSFIRALTGTIALQVTKASKFKGLKRKFWDHRPFTRIVVGFRGYLIAKDYILLNALEALKIIPYQKNRLKGLSGPPLHRLLESSG